MERISIREIAAAIGAEYRGDDAFVDYISTDSRDLQGSCLFVALEGERVDGHDYIPQVLQQGAAFAVAHKPVAGWEDRVLYVKDTFGVLMQIAAMYRRKFPIPAVAVTGSVGKTTTKDFIAQVLSAAYCTLKSEGNNNNEIGLPKTVFKLGPQHEAAVFEMGMDHPGDIAKLTRIIRPDIAVITNIGVSHLEHMGSREAILAGKLEITQGMPDGAPLLLCADNDLLATVRQPRLRVLTYGLEQPADITASDIRMEDGGTAFILHYGQEHLDAVIPALGRHNIYNAMAAFGVGICMGMQPESILQALRGYTPSGMRQRLHKHHGYTVVEDCYNASPDSMQAALETLSAMPCTGRRICVFADMLELGSIAEQAHEQVGRQAAGAADVLYTYGTLVALAAQAATAAGMTQVRHFHDKAQLADCLKELLQEGDILWVKGSRGMRLEEVLEELYRS